MSKLYFDLVSEDIKRNTSLIVAAIYLGCLINFIVLVVLPIICSIIASLFFIYKA